MALPKIIPYLLLFLAAAPIIASAESLFLNSTANAGVGGTDFRYLGAPGALLDAATQIRPSNSGWDYVFDPLTRGSTTAPRVLQSTLNTNAPLYGWATDKTYTGTIASGKWQFNTTTISATATGLIYLNISVWKTCSAQNTNALLFTMGNNTDLTSSISALWLLTSTIQPEFTFGEDCAIKVGYYALTQTGTGGNSLMTFRSNTPSFFVILPLVYRKLESISPDSPLTDLALTIGNTFPISCTGITDNSTNGINVEYQYNTSISPFVPIPVGAGPLAIDSNPETNVRNNSQVSRAVSANSAGEYFVRCRLYNSTSSMYSEARKIIVNPLIAINPTGLNIWDQSDIEGGSLPSFPGESINFFANYTNSTTGLALPFASCMVAFSDQGYAFNPMAFNGGFGVFTYSRTFSAASSIAWNVSCSLAGHQFKFNNDSILITSGPYVGAGKPSYSACGTVYYEAKFYDRSEQLFTPAINVNLTISNSSGIVSEVQVQAANGIYRGIYPLPAFANSGNWQIKALSDAIGKKQFFVRTGNSDVWKIEVVPSVSKGAYASSEIIPTSINVLNLRGVGVFGLVPGVNLLLYRDAALYSPATTSHGNGTYSFNLDFSSLSQGAPHKLVAIANSGGIDISASLGFYVS